MRDAKSCGQKNAEFFLIFNSQTVDYNISDALE